MGGCTLGLAGVEVVSNKARVVGARVGVTSCEDESRLSTDLGATGMLARLEGAGAEAGAGAAAAAATGAGEDGGVNSAGIAPFRNLLTPVFRS